MLSTKVIGSKIAEARKNSSISQAQLAEQLFISPQAVGKWERGESMPDITTFSRIAEILGVDLNYFSEAFQATNQKASSNEPGEEHINAVLDKKDLGTGNEEKKHSWDMSSASWVDADFSGLKNIQEKFNSSNIKRTKFIGSDLVGLRLKNNHIEECDFSSSDINSSHIQGTYMVNNKFKACSLQESWFTENHIKGCDFSKADLTEVKLKSCSFTKNTVVDSVWHHTSFVNTQIEEIIFNGSIDSCYFDNCSFKKVTFQNATLMNTFFKGRKLKGIRFIDCQADRLTYEFLKNGKADLNGITLLKTKE